MLMAIIPIHSFAQAMQLMQQAKHADAFEFRLDYFTPPDQHVVAQLQQAAQKPVMFTLRKPDQGGVYREDEATRLAVLTELVTLQPDYLDIEHDVPLVFCEQLKTISPRTQLVRSFHDFNHTPLDLDGLLQRMQDPIFSYYKIITTAQSIIDTLRVLRFVQQHAEKIPLIAHAMGDLGICSRVLGPVLGNRFTYAAVESQENIAPGLLTVDELVNTYHIQTLNQETQIYGLMGSPVARSIGHQFHNAEFVKQDQNAVYVKFQVTHEELPEFFSLLAYFPIGGLSVTMPHKQAVLDFCSAQTAAVKIIGAANTLIKTSSGFLAANTDGDAVVQVLLAHGALLNKKVILLGAGGAASGIIYSVLQQGAEVTVYNRTVEKTSELQHKFSINTGPLSALADLMPEGYDILINTIPAAFYDHDQGLEGIRHLFVAQKIIMDANYQAEPTLLLKTAAQQHCICIDGYAMFYAQARLQRVYWFGEV